MRLYEFSDRAKVNEMEYEGNIGIMELMQFFRKAAANGDQQLIKKVKTLANLCKPEANKQAWKIIQDYTGTHLQGDEFHECAIKEYIKQIKY